MRNRVNWNVLPRLAISAALLGVTLWLSPSALAQRGAPGGAPAVPQGPPSASAPIDVTGYWVSIVNEDWRWRMVTPPKGDFPGVPVNAEGRKVAGTWDPSKDGLCEAYGAAGLMRMPTRLHVTWENESTLKIETDAGQQTRRFFFDRARTATEGPTLQGHSLAEWERAGGRGAPQTGSLKVVTTSLRPGWLRRNGVPYSENTSLTEHFDRFAAPNGDEWLVVTTIVTDPKYLTGEFVTSSHFKRERDGAKWSPFPCRAS